VPDARFQHINIGLIGPLPPSNGYRYCLTVIDRFSRWPPVVPLTEITAEEVVSALLHEWIAHYGVPVRITSNQGRQFESGLFKELSRILGVKLIARSRQH